MSDAMSDAMSDVVRYEVDDGVAWLTIDRPEARNALNIAVRTGLWDGFRRFNDDDSAGVLVLTAAGDKAFCAGGDLKEMAEEELKVPPADFVPMPGRNIDVPKPTIAAVNGVAFAGGFALAQYCDLCIAAEHARFSITEAKVGRGSPWAAPLPWLIPPRVAMQLVLTAEPISARRAHEIGLVNEVVPGDELHAAAQAMARTILGNAPLSVRAGKRTIYAAAGESFGRLLDEAERIWEPAYLSADAQEGPAAFREGRAPRWQGR
jgi:enoyl-CoA hydratase/carnithine racemase